MKRVMYVISCLISLLFMPIHVFAADGIEVSKTSLTIEQGTNVTFNMTATNVAVHVTYSLSDSSIIFVENVPDWIDSEPGKSMSKTVRVHGLKIGTSTITFDTTVATYDEKEYKKTIEVVVNVVAPKSSNNSLKELKIDGVLLNNFNASTTNYTLKNTDASSITVSAVASDSKASVSGSGTKKLSYGVNTINIVVTAENGNKKTYILKVTRNDRRSSDNLLSSLTVSSGEFIFDSNKTSYTVVVDEDVEELKVDATAKSTKAKVSGIGTVKLKPGINEIRVVVTAENGSEKVYLLSVVKQDKDSAVDNLSSNNDLKSLIVKGYNINFKSDELSYYLDVSKDIDKINIEAVCEDSKAIVSMNNPEKLKFGENIITIDVTAENGDVQTYKIYVNRLDDVENNAHSCIYKVLSIIELVVIVSLIVILILLKRKK